MDELFSKRIPVTQKSPEREDRKSHIQITVENHTVTAPVPRKELVIRLTDDQDLFFLYTLRLTEEDFQSLKTQQGLLVDYGSFPQKFIDLLELCLQEEHKEAPKFILHLVSNGTSGSSTANLNVIETNPFKHLTHLSLKFLPGTDGDIKKYLASCLKNLKDQNDTLVHKLEHTESELSQQLRQAREALATRTQELDSLKAEWTARTSDITSRHAQLVNEEKERTLQSQTTTMQRFHKDKADAEQAHLKTTKQLEARLYELETTNKDLTDRKYKSELTVRELRSKLAVLEEEHQRAKQDLAGLRKNNAGLDSDYHEQEKSMNQLRTRLAVLEQEVKDKEEVLKKTTELMKNEQEQRRKSDEEVERKKRHLVKLEASIKTMSDELIKGNEIIKKLQGEIRNYHTKLKLRNQVTTEQEKLLTEKNKEMEEIRKDLEQVKVSLKHKEDENQKLNTDLESTLQKLEESRQLLKTNENVINWLNKQVTESQLGQQQQHTGMRHGTFELNSTASSAGAGSAYRAQSGLLQHNFSAPSYGAASRMSTSAASHQSVGSTAGAMPASAPNRQQQVQYHLPGQGQGQPQPAKSVLPIPVAKSSPINTIPEDSRHSVRAQLSPQSSPALAPPSGQQGHGLGRGKHQAHSHSDPFLDAKYFQRADNATGRSVGHTTSPTSGSIHFVATSATTTTTTHVPSTRLSKDIVMPRADTVMPRTHVPKAMAQPPLASAYFPGQPNAT